MAAGHTKERVLKLARKGLGVAQIARKIGRDTPEGRERVNEILRLTGAQLETTSDHVPAFVMIVGGTANVLGSDEEEVLLVQEHAIELGFGVSPARHQPFTRFWTFSLVLGSRVGEDIAALLGVEPG